MKQPVLGIVATLGVMAISLAFIALFSFATFSGWVAYLLMCVIPMQIVIGVTWGADLPGFAAAPSQPVRGLLLTMLSLAAGAIVAVAALALFGARVTPPAPILVHWIIVSIPVMFCGAVMWGGWPFTAVIKNKFAAGLTMLVVCYAANALLFRFLFNYEFMRGAPVYVAALDPHGLFNGWSALVFYVTALAGMFLMIGFDLWPLTTVPALMTQPVLGLVWTLCTFGFAAAAMYVGIGVRHMDVVRFLVRVPVPLIFGAIVVLNMLQNSLFASFAQPAKGVLNAAAIVVVGTVLSMACALTAPTVTGHLAAGPPAYDFEIWLASALLSVTFPFLIFFAEFFKYWPLATSQTPVEAQAPTAR
ncbi:MAG TPA: hypothetical protein VG871_16040 [Vicinamibacterales bacterium]|nr:hypothetical protein [Vicinamibacterales bacterium]